MIYRFVRALLKITLSIFFKKIVVTGIENIPEQGPMIIVANHPNTLLDPLIIASITTQRIGFIANASIFSGKPVIAVLRYFHVIPIFRKKDVAPGEKQDNTEAFSKCHEYLSEGRTFLIFPEGSSIYELKLREIKTGTARIALSFEAQNNFQSNLKILPISLDYSDSLQFNSMVSVTVHAPISCTNYKVHYLQNTFEAVRELTENIRIELVKNIPQTTGKEQEEFLIYAHKFYTAFYEPDADLYTNTKRSLELRTQLSKALQYTEKKNNHLYQTISLNLRQFYNSLNTEKLTTGFFTDQFLKKNKWLVCAGYLISFILLLPFYIVGLLTNYLPYILPSKIYAALNIDIEYKSSVQMISGLFTFPLFYSLELWLFRIYISAQLWSTLLLLIILPATGYLAMYFWTEVQRFVRVVHFYFFMKTEAKSKLLKLRDEILDNMAQAKENLVRLK